METESLKRQIEENAVELRRLKEGVNSTFKHRSKSPEHKERWQRACGEFHARYGALAFPGGLEGAYERILSGDAPSIEAGLCFLEVRPFFFRSGYMFKKLVPKLKRANLSPGQKLRLGAFLVRLAKWRKEKQNAAQRAGS